jgi:hypothetical protein
MSFDAIMKTYSSGIDFHSSPKVLVILHQNRSGTNNSSNIHQNVNWSNLLFDFIDSFVYVFLVGCIEFPAFRLGTFLLDKFERFTETSKIEKSKLCSCLGERDGNCLANSPSAAFTSVNCGESSRTDN